MSAQSTVAKDRDQLANVVRNASWRAITSFQGALQYLHLQRPAQTQRDRHIQRRIPAGLHLVEQPKAALRQGRRENENAFVVRRVQLSSCAISDFGNSRVEAEDETEAATET